MDKTAKKRENKDLDKCAMLFLPRESLECVNELLFYIYLTGVFFYTKLDLCSRGLHPRRG